MIVKGPVPLLTGFNCQLYLHCLFSQINSAVDSSFISKTKNAVDISSPSQPKSDIDNSSISQINSAVDNSSISNTKRALDRNSVSQVKSAVTRISISQTNSAVDSSSISLEIWFLSAIIFDYIDPRDYRTSLAITFPWDPGGYVRAFLTDRAAHFSRIKQRSPGLRIDAHPSRIDGRSP